MKTKSLTLFKALSVTAALSFTAVLSGTASAATLSHVFKQGEVMCLVSSINQENNAELKSAYFQGVFPVAKQIGFEFIVNLYVDKQLAGNHAAPAFSLIKLPSTQAKIDLNNKHLVEWGHFRKQRPQIWKELIAREYEMTRDLTLNLDDEKYYQVETFWVQRDRGLEFVQFRNDVEATIGQYQGKVLYKAGLPSDYETLGSNRAPSHMVITEWPSKAAFEDFAKQKQAQPFKYLGGYNAWLMKPRIQA